MAKRKNVGSMSTSKLRVFHSFEEFEAQVNADIEWNVKRYAESMAKSTFQEVLEERVYDAYTPVESRRRKENGGLLDEGYIFASISGHNGNYELVMTDYAPWQNFRADYNMPRIPLADAIESGECMHGAGARPFYLEAEGRIAEELDSFLQQELG